MNLRNAFSKQKKSIAPSGGEMLTQQSMKDEVDINNITSRYINGGALVPPGATRQPMFGDFSNAQDFQVMQNALADTQQAFLSLSSKIRNRFDNSPYQLLRFLDDPANLPEAIKLGLVDPPPVVEAETAVPPVVAPPAVKADPEANPDFKKP